jgi:glycosyltransferase involved in cell wall biosynthesis
LRRDKPKIALLGISVIDGPESGRGIPVINDLVSRLSHHFDFTFYSFGPVSARTIPGVSRIRNVDRVPLPGRVKYLLLALLTILDHLRRPYKAIFAVSVVPAGMRAVFLGRILGTQSIVQLISVEAIGMKAEGIGYLLRPWHAKKIRRVCKSVDHLVAVAGYQKQMMQKSLPTSREIVVLPLRIDPAKFPYSNRSISYPIQFIHIAYYSPVKDQDTMFRCFARLSKIIDCRLTVIGMGYDSPKVHEMLAQLDILDKILITGVLRQSELLPHLQKAHIMLHTARFETGCAVIQEAMASGVAVCGTAVGILADIGDRYAEMVKPGDDEGLATKVLQLINDPVRYETMTRDAHEWITTYDAAWSAENYRLFLDKALKK